jgi:hypothetical protein
MHTATAEPKTQPITHEGQRTNPASGWWIIPSAIGGAILIAIFWFYPATFLCYAAGLVAIGVASFIFLKLNNRK